MPAGKTDMPDTSGLLVKARSLAELNIYEFANVSKATVKYLARQPSAKKAPFTYEWLLRVHRDMLGDVWSWAGKIRSANKNIGIPKSDVSAALQNLLHDYYFWLANKMNLEEISARLHHRLVWIHPFENGNGRWARLITNIFQRQQELPLIQWPEKKLVEQNDLRSKYLAALKKADRQDFSELIELQKMWMMK